ncbi:hypothetical protein WAK64_13865 [Bacillus spongiae]|uniref:Uncharacterized protein n=1 Tax=Bacillus spongiae TaxID=2683610 RepID=A0ABU8HG39_9BACI
MLGLDILLFLLFFFLVTIFLFSATFAVIFLFQRGKCDKKDNCLCFLGPFLAIGAVAIAVGILIAVVFIIIEQQVQIASGVHLLQQFI